MMGYRNCHYIVKHISELDGCTLWEMRVSEADLQRTSEIRPEAARPTLCSIGKKWGAGDLRWKQRWIYI